MSMGDFDHGSLRPGAEATDRVEHILSAQRVVGAYRQAGGVLTYDLPDSLVFTVGIEGDTLEGEEIEQSRIIQTRLVERNSGLLKVVIDTAASDSWQDREINLGSVIGRDGPITRGGLLRGFIMPGMTVAVDLDGTHFRMEEQVHYLAANYRTASADDTEIF